MPGFDINKDVFELSKKPLVDILFEANGKTDKQFIKEKTHIRFLLDYLGRKGLDANYAVLEENYVNKDYLKDYSTYYSTCFESYPKTGSRLHFFSTQLTLEQFKKRFFNVIIAKDGDSTKIKEFWDEYYLGYIVVKPIPNLFVGFTLLKHYNYNSNKKCFDSTRIYWGIKNYKKHIFGTEVNIPSLAFQEQDQNVAACATIAIWSMLQIAAEDYYVNLQSPSEITQNGGVVSFNGNRLLPNKGLSVLQMSQAVTQNNLVTEVRERTDYKGDASFNLYIKKLIHAYSNLRIPPILIINLSPPDQKASNSDVELEDESEFDGHAVAVSGYKMRPLGDIRRRNRLLKRVSKLFKDESITWKADLIEKIYAHDDQWGPFARMTFSGKDRINTSWELTGAKYKLSRTEGLLVAVYPKVRVAYDDIESKVIRLNNIFVNHLQDQIKGDFVWDIQIFYSDDFKTIIRTSDKFDSKNSYDKRLLFTLQTKSLPKYIWVATLQIEEQQALHFIYDATGLSGSNIILSIFGYFPRFTRIFKQILERHQNIRNTTFTYIFDYDIRAYIIAIID